MSDHTQWQYLLLVLKINAILQGLCSPSSPRRIPREVWLISTHTPIVLVLLLIWYGIY